MKTATKHIEAAEQAIKDVKRCGMHDVGADFHLKKYLGLAGAHAQIAIAITTALPPEGELAEKFARLLNELEDLDADAQVDRRHDSSVGDAVMGYKRGFSDGITQAYALARECAGLVPKEGDADDA